ncbi:hypothetical protein GGI35DRAFT_490880 [Trichoderma velutinum]
MSQQIHRILAPKTSPTPSREAESKNRSGTSIWCNGREPCFRCRKDNVDCTYGKRQREAIADVLAENERLKKSNTEKDKLLQPITYSHDVEACISIVDKLKEDNKTRQDGLRLITSTQIKNNNFKIGDAPKEAVTMGLPNSGIGPAICPFCSCRLRPWSFPRYPSNSEMSANAIATLSAGGITYVRQLINFSTTWDFLPFCLICKVPFLHAYDTRSSDFCSTALVNALIALAIRVTTETENETGPSPANGIGSKQFFDNAERFLGDGRQPNHLPDIQAVGIMSIYKVTCGGIREAQTLAQLLWSGITDLCNRHPPEEENDTQYALACTTTYCGAVSLIRLIRLVACGQSFNLSNLVLEQDPIILDQSLCGLTSTCEDNGDLRFAGLGIDAHSSKLCGIHLIGAKIFQLTEWTYKNLSGLDATSKDVPLNRLISDFFTLQKGVAANTPSTLYIHMYYHFCLLVLFRPFSAQAILSLGQSYRNLFTLRRISGFVPYFISAADAYGRAVADSLSSVDAASVRILTLDDAVPIVSLELPR